MKQPLLIKTGDQAKNFSLKDQNDKTFDLYENMEKRVLLSFHPLAWTEYCAAQMKSLEDNHELFWSLNTVTVGISVDSIPRKKAWAGNLGITSTPHSSGKKTVFPKGQMSSLMSCRKSSLLRCTRSIPYPTSVK